MRSGFQRKTRGKGIPGRGVNEAPQASDRMHPVQAGQTQRAVVSAKGCLSLQKNSRAAQRTNNACTDPDISQPFLGTCFLPFVCYHIIERWLLQHLTPRLPTNMSKAGRKGRPDSREFSSTFCPQVLQQIPAFLPPILVCSGCYIKVL